MKRTLILCMFIAVAIWTYAQKKGLVFQSQTYNWGVIDTEITGNSVTCTFPFVNKGGNACTIKRAVLRSGQMSIDYPRTPIQPNEKGELTIRYDLSLMIKSQLESSSQDFPFKKSFVIITDQGQKTSLYITGTVRVNLPSEKEVKEKDGFVWYRIFKNGKFGAKNITGNEIIPPIYEKVSCHPYGNEEKYFIVVDDNNYEGIYTQNGNNIIPTSRGYIEIFKSAYRNFESYYVFRTKDSSGFCDINGKEILRIPYSIESSTLLPCYEHGKFYITYVHIYDDSYNLLSEEEKIVDCILGLNKVHVSSAIIDGNGKIVVEPVDELILLNNETLSFEYLDPEQNKNIICGKLSDVKTTKNPFVNNSNK